MKKRFNKEQIVRILCQADQMVVEVCKQHGNRGNKETQADGGAGRLATGRGGPICAQQRGLLESGRGPDFQRLFSTRGKLEGAGEGIGGISPLAEVIGVDAVR